jgi:hypothetical protein
MIEMNYTILRHLTPREVCGRFYLPELESWDIEALKVPAEWEREVHRNCDQPGLVIAGPSHEVDNGIVTEVLVGLPEILSLADLLLLHGTELCKPSGDIFVSATGTYHVTATRLTKLEGEVLTAVYEDLHGSSVGCLDDDFPERLIQWAKRNLRRAGVAEAVIITHIHVWRRLVLQHPPCDLTFEMLGSYLVSVFGMEASANGK